MAKELSNIKVTAEGDLDGIGELSSTPPAMVLESKFSRYSSPDEVAANFLSLVDDQIEIEERIFTASPRYLLYLQTAIQILQDKNLGGNIK